MTSSARQLRADALAIWQAGIEAVRSDHLVREAVAVDGDRLEIGGQPIDLTRIGRIAVVGAGKAGAGMARGLIEALGPRVVRDKRVSGWVNVPADCVVPLEAIHLHAARAAGVNEPSAEGVIGSREILRLVSSLASDDLCIALISGGASALLPDPIEGVSLEDKLLVTRHLSAAGAPIEDLNTVRKQLSRIKGGKLAAACRAGRLATLVISDVLGDPLDTIGSGPTVVDRSTPADALAVLEGYGAREAGISPCVFDALARRAEHAAEAWPCTVTNLVIGNNAVAVKAAAAEASRLGYSPRASSANKSEGPAETIGRELAEAALAMLRDGGCNCLISGGEPTVKLISTGERGRGGRNQQLVLAAVDRLAAGRFVVARGQDLVILSGGTDGEDGPTDAAGAVTDGTLLERARELRLEPGDYLRRNDAYSFFEALDCLIKTGPTHTNVCDVRVVLVDRG
jgi:hydroxypyruvate reductase